MEFFLGGDGERRLSADRLPGNSTPKRIHITGTPRSGTTLFLSLMLSCFDIDGGVLAERRLWRTPPKGRRISCTKFPDETDFATAMLELDPDLHVIFIVRDPRDVVASRSHISPGGYLTNLRVWRENLEAAKPYFGHPRFHLVDYSRLTLDPDEVQDRLSAAMPFLARLRPFSNFVAFAREEEGGWLHDMDLELRPVAPDRVGNWRQHLPRVKGQLAIHGEVSDDLIALGFERTKEWLSLLEGVEPDLTPSAAVEMPHFGKRVTRIWRNMIGTIVYLARRYLGLELSDTGEGKSMDASTPAANENLVPQTPTAATRTGNNRIA